VLLKNHCEKKLNDATLRIEKIKFSSDKNYTKETFEK